MYLWCVLIDPLRIPEWFQDLSNQIEYIVYIVIGVAIAITPIIAAHMKVAKIARGDAQAMIGLALAFADFMFAAAVLLFIYLFFFFNFGFFFPPL